MVNNARVEYGGLGVSLVDLAIVLDHGRCSTFVLGLLGTRLRTLLRLVLSNQGARKDCLDREIVRLFNTSMCHHLDSSYSLSAYTPSGADRICSLCLDED